LSPENLIGGPSGVSGPYQWLDLYGEGIPGILTQQATGWYYKSNLGDGNFSRMLEVATKPSMRGVSSGALQFLDLAADGSKQLLSMIRQPRGYFELDDENNWLPFREFMHLANLPPTSGYSAPAGHRRNFPARKRNPRSTIRVDQNGGCKTL
jgi:hypothetical protein